ncbi:MAG: M1 family aminopeptidase, partial [Saprospiraceae bacterium]|nr:M1 family aminopeptidase [Saprospiraceae bacterium]
QARNSFIEPVLIATEREARARERKHLNGVKTWHFKADRVRDFAFASSRKFIWDAMAVKQNDGSTVMAMSMYPREGNPLWEKYSTKVVAHTLKWYSHYTFDYPYPVAWSINAANIGMEYPMISFNFGRPNADNTYSKRTKYSMISVIIHEVGHNYFPMIVNSDERQWTWMDEGLNTFLQYLTEQQFERNYPSRYGPAHKIVDYMKGDKSFISPIMTNSESIHQIGNNAHGKPATALNILRETILGRELFDVALKDYSKRWKFKHPTPADFFRTMEDASAVDLDWFWRGWFYSTDHVDISLDEVAWFNIDSEDPLVDDSRLLEERDNSPRDISQIRNASTITQTYDQADPMLRDFYTNYDPLESTSYDQRQYEELIDSLTEREKRILNNQSHYYELTFSNKGGLPMPIILDFEFLDGTHEEHRIPAEIWRFNDESINKVFVFEKILKRIVVDPYLETADVDRTNNYFPQQIIPSRFQLYREKKRMKQNPMQRLRAENP